jgi:hypothetical protein
LIGNTCLLDISSFGEAFSDYYSYHSHELVILPMASIVFLPSFQKNGSIIYSYTFLWRYSPTPALAASFYGV